MSEAMDAQKAGKFQEMTERDREIQASVWALIFLVAELSLALRAMRDKLHERGALLPEDEAAINGLCTTEERIRTAYAHVENAFQEKYGRVMEAMLHPADVEQAMQAHMDQEGTTPMVSGTNPEGEN